MWCWWGGRWPTEAEPAEFSILYSCFLRVAQLSFYIVPIYFCSMGLLRLMFVLRTGGPYNWAAMTEHLNHPWKAPMRCFANTLFHWTLTIPWGQFPYLYIYMKNWLSKRLHLGNGKALAWMSIHPLPKSMLIPLCQCFHWYIQDFI